MVDGMGPCGTEGTFIRTAEETTRILRKNAGALLTILSAVVADPLYRWNLSPVEAGRRQTTIDEEMEAQYVVDHDVNGGFADMSSKEDQNKEGTKTIAHINEKLLGYEDSTSGEQQGVEGQVQLLINSARDPDNLCEMYHGWAPWV
jgi:ataxia telangiectasia mutated family protein